MNSDAPNKQHKTNPQTKLLELTSKESRSIRRMSFLTAASSTLWLGQAYLIAAAFASLIAGERDMMFVTFCALGFIILGCLRAALSTFAELGLNESADKIIGVSRQKLLEQEQQVSPFAQKAASSAEIAVLLIDKHAQLTPYLTRYTPAMTRAKTLPMIILAVAFSMSWAVGLVLLIAGPLIPIFMALVGMAAKDASEKQMDELASMNSLLLERLNALIDIRLLAAETKVVKQFQDGADRLRKQTMSVLKVAFLSSTVLEFFSAVGVAMVAVYVGFALLGEIPFGAYQTPLTPFEGIFLLLLAPEFFQPLRDVAAAWHDRAAAEAVARDIAELEERGAQTMLLSPKSTTRQEVEGPLTWSELTFPGPPPFKVPRGQVSQGEAVAIVGESGSGKSTLIAALGGIIKPETGQIAMGKAPLSAGTASSIRRNIAWMPQAPHFFSGSLRDNLTLHGEISVPVEQALKLASAQHIVDRLPEGLDTQLSENGAGVSGGEARRLMLARTALQDASIILADEPTADLDEETTQQVINGLLQLREEGATIIVATHDPRLSNAMDREYHL